MRAGEWATDRQEAIAHYGLTAKDLFGKLPVAAQPKPPRKASTKAAKATKSTAPAKYQDDAGHQWSGIGKRPNWFKTALTSGKTAADLLIDKPPAA